jgi:CMP-N-acetylneuraminic acid synthetase
MLALIPARGGSTGLPRKNVLPLGGKPLIAWTIEAAQKAASVERVLVSTDDPEIAEAARQAGAPVPWFRPAHLATGDAKSLDVALHAIEMLGPGAPEWLALLQPTSPLRTARDIDGAAALRGPEVDAIVGVCPAATHPHLALRISEAGFVQPFFETPRVTRRQDLPEAYAVSGALYIVRVAALRALRTFRPPATRPWLMPSERSVDIDTEWDFAVAETALQRGTV